LPGQTTWEDNGKGAKMSEDKKEQEDRFTPEQEEWLKQKFEELDKIKEQHMPPEIQRFSKPIFYKLDENKNPVPCTSYEFDFDHRHFEERKRVALTQLGPYVITTVFLAIDHNWTGQGKPVLFETMIWSEKGTKHEFFNEQWRYCTWAEAKDGHDVIVKLVEEGVLP
jgi:hypothetical protein